MKIRHRWAALAAIVVAASPFAGTTAGQSGEVLPPEPKQHYTDYSGLVCHLCVDRDNGRLEKFERRTGNRIIVAVYPKMQSGASIEDYTARVFKSWEVGRRKNGAAIFVFLDTRLMYFQVGSGLKKTLPDSVVWRIFENEMMPGFQRGEFGEGVSQGLTAIMKTLSAKSAVE